LASEFKVVPGEEQFWICPAIPVPGVKYLSPFWSCWAKRLPGSPKAAANRKTKRDFFMAGIGKREAKKCCLGDGELQKLKLTD
jgi:hypothetical protein